MQTDKIVSFLDSLVGAVKTEGVKLLGGLIVLIVGFFLVHWILVFMERNSRFIRCGTKNIYDR